MCIRDSQKHNQIDPAFYERYRVKRGLRNADGTGVMAGVTQIGNVMGYYVQDGERIPAPGKLVYRGIDVEELINGFVSEGRFGFEETAYLLLFGALPTRAQLTAFEGLLSACLLYTSRGGHHVHVPLGIAPEGGAAAGAQHRRRQRPHAEHGFLIANDIGCYQLSEH